MEAGLGCENRPWLSCSVKRMVLYVHGVCFRSGGRESRESPFIGRGFNKWKRGIYQSKPPGYFDRHAKSVRQREADVRIMGFRNNRRQPGTDIQSKLAKQLANQRIRMYKQIS